MKKKFTTLLLGIAASSILITGCSSRLPVVPDSASTPSQTSETTLEDVYSSEQAQATINGVIENLLKQYDGYYSDINIYFVENDVYYDYYYAPDFHPDIASVASVDADSAIRQAKDSFEKESGIRPNNVIFQYFDSVGNLLYSTETGIAQTTDNAEMTLEEYYNQPDKRDEIDAAIAENLNAYSDYYSNMNITFSNNYVYYDYYYNEDVEPDLDYLQEFDYTDVLKTSADEIANDCGITPDAVIFTYFDYDGNVLYTTENEY